MKIVIIGAGSASFGVSMIRDLLVCPELGSRGASLHLVDTDATALDRAMLFAAKLREHTGSDMALEKSLDRRSALDGADFVIVSVARKRYELWEQDFRVPLAHGFRHCLGENGGPGAAFHALRSFELVIPICKDIEEICPDALVLNFTNPEMRVLHAINHLTGVRAAGLCHGIGGAIDTLQTVLDRPADEFKIVSAGMNHLYAVLQVTDKQTGEDLLGEAKRRVLAAPAGEVPPLFRRILDVFDVFSFPSDDHIGEYVAFAEEFLGVKWPYGQESRPVVPNPPGPEPSWFDNFLDGTGPLPEWFLNPSGELAVPIICDIDGDRKMYREAVNVLNTDLSIENLPPGAAVEVPATVDAAGIHPEKVGPLPEPFAAIIRPQLTIAELLTEAYRTGSKKLVLQALLLDPVVDNTAEAEKMLDEMLELQADFLPVLE